jgi:hypothetical protein
MGCNELSPARLAGCPCRAAIPGTGNIKEERMGAMGMNARKKRKRRAHASSNKKQREAAAAIVAEGPRPRESARKPARG